MSRCIKCNSAFADENGLCWLCRGVTPTDSNAYHNVYRTSESRLQRLEQEIQELKERIEKLKFNP